MNVNHKIQLILTFFQLLNVSIFCQDIRVKIKSDYQEDSSYLRIINSTITEDSNFNLVFVLPVEAFKENYKYRSGIDECKKLIDSYKISNNVVFIQPDYIRIPWYGNHISNKSIWQLDFTVDLIKSYRLKYSNKKFKVYLLGFSKSGWGSMNILIKYPELIDGILIWDAPLSTKWNEKWGMHYSFGNEENFMNNYYLMRENGIEFERLKNKKIVIGGYDLFEKQTKDFLIRLDENDIKYIYDDNLRTKHEWNKDWILRLLYYIHLSKE